MEDENAVPGSTPRNETYDVVVAGGGAAGLSAALSLTRSRRSVLVVDAGSPRNARAGHMHNYLGREGAAPADLLADGRAEVTSYGGELLRGSVVSAEPWGDGADVGFDVVIAGETAGDSGGDRESGPHRVSARRLIVTTGVVDALPDVAGVAGRWGRDVLHCPYCHGWEVRDQAIGVLATGPMAMHQALMFRQLSADVVLFQHTAAPFDDEQLEQLGARGIDVVAGKVVEVEVTDDRVTGLRLESGAVVPRQAVVVMPVPEAQGTLLDSLGLPTSELLVGDSVIGRYVPSERMGVTAVPGVWVAGNVTDLMAQVVGAAAAGELAGAAVNADLVTEDTRRAVAGVRSRAA